LNQLIIIIIIIIILFFIINSNFYNSLIDNLYKINRLIDGFVLSQTNLDELFTLNLTEL